jgi:REP element-mobilizing transposase RayT
MISFGLFIHTQRFAGSDQNSTISQPRKHNLIMANSFIFSYYHCVFSTKDRRNLITPNLQIRLFPYIGGIAREHKIHLHAVGGMPDHIHLLMSLPSTISVAKALQLIKGGSSKWIHETLPEHKDFAWQKGYGAFSVGISDIERTRIYIENQQKHHVRRDFKEEFLVFLKRNGIEYDERYVF